MREMITHRLALAEAGHSYLSLRGSSHLSLRGEAEAISLAKSQSLISSLQSLITDSWSLAQPYLSSPEGR